MTLMHGPQTGTTKGRVSCTFDHPKDWPCSICNPQTTPSPIGRKFLSFVDHNRTGPLTDRELSDILNTSWALLLEEDHTGDLAHLVFRLADEISKRRVADAKN